MAEAEVPLGVYREDYPCAFSGYQQRLLYRWRPHARANGRRAIVLLYLDGDHGQGTSCLIESPRIHQESSVREPGCLRLVEVLRLCVPASRRVCLFVALALYHEHHLGVGRGASVRKGGASRVGAVGAGGHLRLWIIGPLLCQLRRISLPRTWLNRDSLTTALPLHMLGFGGVS